MHTYTLYFYIYPPTYIQEGFLMDAMTVVALYRAGRFQEVEFNHGSASFTPATTTNKKKSD